MHLIRLQDVNKSEEKLTQAVLQITQMLGIYHAELARILNLQCADISKLLNARGKIHTNTDAWFQAIKYVEIYENLYYLHDGNEAKIYNWLRNKNKNFQVAPLYLMVDELCINRVLEILK